MRVKFGFLKRHLDRFSSEYYGFPCIIPPTLHIHTCLHVEHTRRTNGRSLGTFPKAMFSRKSGSTG